MSITRSYNKHTGIWYAYETDYIWDDTLKKKVQKKKCIGQFDPKTGEVIPNGGRGRPRKTEISDKHAEESQQRKDNSMSVSIENISSRLAEIDKLYRNLLEAVNALGEDISRLQPKAPGKTEI